MGIIIDLIIIAFILLSIFLGYRKGLVSLAIGACTFIIALVVTLILYKPVGNLVINTTGIDEMIQNTILEKVNDVIAEDSETSNQLIESAKNGLLPETSKTLANNIVYGGVMLILFIGAKIALRLVKAIANLIAKLPIISQFNKLGGALYGLLRGALLVYVVLMIIAIIGTVNPKNVVHKNLNESTLGKTMYENNILNMFF